VLRLQESRRRYASVTILAETRTTFRYVAGEPTLSASRLRRPSLAASRLAHPRANVLPRATRFGHANGHPTRYEDPALLTELAEKPMK